MTTHVCDRFFRFATMPCRWILQGSMSRAVISEICVADFGSSPLLCFSLTQCLGQHWKAERSRLVLSVLPVSHLENSSPPACCIINQKLNPLSSNVSEWWTVHFRTVLFCSRHFYKQKKNDWSTRCKIMLGIRDCLSSLPLHPFKQAGCDFPNRQDNVTISILFFCSICFYEWQAEAR